MLTISESMLESKCERIARIMTRHYGVTVTIGGGDAVLNMETKEIRLPALSNEEVDRLGFFLDGFLDHECAHVVHTKYEDVKTLDGPLREIWNAVEDTWIEREMGKQYIGCGQNLGKLRGAIGKDIKTHLDKLEPLDTLLFAMQQIWAEGESVSDYATDPKIGKLLPLFQPEIDRGFTVSSTKEAVALATQILEKLQDESKKQEPEPKSEPKPENKPEPKDGEPGDSGDGDEPGEGSPKEGKSDDNTDSGKNDGDTDKDPGEESASDDSAGDGKPGEGSDDAGDEPGDGEPQKTPGEPEGTEGDDSPGEAQPVPGEPEDSSTQAQAIQDQIDSGDVSSDLDMEKRFANELQNIPDRSTRRDPEEYIVFSEKYDEDTEYDADYRIDHSKLYSELKEKVTEYVGPMSNTLASALLAETESYWVGGVRRGRKADRRRMSRWFMGSDDDRIWKYQEQGQDWDTAVVMLWDCSGSMGSSTHGPFMDTSKAALARVAAVAFHETLLRANIPHEVLGFNSGGLTSAELVQEVNVAKASGHDLRRYSRLAKRDNRMVFVPFGTTDGRALCAITGGSANRDGECVLWAAKRLAARPEKRKILIVGSDGLPSGSRYKYTEKKYLQTVVSMCMDAGLEVYGIGIKNEAVKKYYPNWCIIRRVSDLPTVVMGQLAKMLSERKGTENGNQLPAIFRKANS